MKVNMQNYMLLHGILCIMMKNIFKNIELVQRRIKFLHNFFILNIYIQNRLKHDIETTTSACEQSVFVFDEVDKMPIKLLETVLYYIDFHTPNYAQPIDFRKTIFIFLR